MDNDVLQTKSQKTVPPDVFHVLNNQLQILLVSTEKLHLAAQDEDARKNCSAIQKSARRIADLIGTLAKASTPSTPISEQQWPQLQALLASIKREAGA